MPKPNKDKLSCLNCGQILNRGDISHCSRDCWQTDKKDKGNIIDRFLSKLKTTKTIGCWEWTASKNKKGYGWFYMNGKNHLAHRASFILFRGNIGAGLHVCHKCDNPSCVNPDHLFISNNEGNILDKINKGRHAKTRTREGAEWVLENKF